MEYDPIELAIYADHTNPYAYGQIFDEMVNKLVIGVPKI